MSRQSLSCGHPEETLMSVGQAQLALLAAVRCVGYATAVALDDAPGRVLAIDLVSPIDVPGFDNSAMDGYAIAFGPDPAVPLRYKVTQRIPAGAVGAALEPGCAARIFTGAPVPPGADAVVVQEAVQYDGDEIIVDRAVPAGANIRPRGNAIARHDVVLTAGQCLAAQHIALAASIGLDSLPVYRRLRVGVFFTGDELVCPGTPLQPGQIYNTNRHAITALLRGMGCEVQDLGGVPDSLDATCKALGLLARDCDLLLTTGGVSVGEEDHVRPAVEKLGRLSLWRVAMKPGKPLAFGAVADTPFIGLPGNPVSAFVTWLLFAAPLIRKMQGRRDPLPRSLPVTSMSWAQRLKPVRRVAPRCQKSRRG